MKRIIPVVLTLCLLLVGTQVLAQSAPSADATGAARLILTYLRAVDPGLIDPALATADLQQVDPQILVVQAGTALDTLYAYGYLADALYAQMQQALRTGLGPDVWLVFMAEVLNGTDNSLTSAALAAHFFGLLGLVVGLDGSSPAAMTFSLLTNANGAAAIAAAYESAVSPVNPGERVAICHMLPNGRSITLHVAPAAVQAHLNHGDTLGACS